MDFDFTPYFQKYQELVNASDVMFDRIKKEFPDCVKCEIKCADCCHALFDLSLIEAIYMNHQFHAAFKNKTREKEAILEAANKADRQIYKIKKNAFKEMEAGKPETEILSNLAKERVRCPLLDSENGCILYDHRPITCRLYGIPTSIGGQGHTCGKSAFKKGEPYPTVNIDLLHTKLFEISARLTADLKSRYVKMADMLVPLSMALLNVYNEEYLGVGEEKEDEGKEKDDV